MEAVYKTQLTAGSLAGASKSASQRRSLKCVFAKDAPTLKRDKVVIAAAVAGLAMDVSTASVAELETMHGPSARTCVLQTAEGTITQSNAVLRYIAAVAPAAELYGRDSHAESQVDQWLEFAALEVEVAVLAVLAAPKDAATCKAASGDVSKALKVLDGVLKGKTFLVGARLTLADIALALTLSVAFSAKIVPADFAATPHALRWLLTCLHSPCFVKVLGAPALKPPPEGQKAAVVVKTAVAKKDNPAAMYPASFKRGRTRVKELTGCAVGSTVTVKGWVRTLREAEKGSINFIELNDGSSMASIQVVASSSSTGGFDALKKCGGAGSSVSATGVIVESMGKGQTIEIAAATVIVLGTTQATTYPLAKKFHTLEHLRTHAHLRPRARFGSAVCRVRHALAFATHEFFNGLGFAYIHTPLITGSDCEGAGEMFAVTTLMPEKGSGHRVPTLPNGDVDYARDFFGKRVGLSVSGQLNVETHAAALSDCYTFGPTFRAENSHTSRHLAEFWMIEPEVSFADIHTDLALAQDFLKFCLAAVLQRCDEDLEFFEKQSPGLRERLLQIVETPFVVLEYTEAVELLIKDIAAKKVKFENPKVHWGVDLGSEHERYLTDVVYKAPVVLINYPKDIKAFYMKLNPDGKTVAAMDILVPKIGELIGGSQREDDLEVLHRRCKEVGVDPADLKWYCDLREYGSVPHAGFGLGFERLVMLATGVENIRDVIPFPRYPGHCAF